MKKIIRILSISFVLMLTTMSILAINFGHNGYVWLQGGKAWSICKSNVTTAVARADVKNYAVASYINFPGFYTVSVASTRVGDTRSIRYTAPNGVVRYHYHSAYGSYIY